MKILIIEPYFTGSHKQWAESYKINSSHNIKILSLKGQFWKWRMHGGAITLAKMFNAMDWLPDLIFATDMLDLNTFLSLTRNKSSGIPTAIYFHENQLSYPWSPYDRDIKNKRDRHYGFINYSSALAADKVFFNSEFHMKSFLDALFPFLKQFPDYQELETIDIIKACSCKVGIAINPDTSLSVLDDIINEIDLILLMSVYPGFGGQEFIEDTIEKIQAARNLIDKQDHKIYLEVDGGINNETISRVSKAGADVFVAGSAIFGSSDYEQTIESFRQKIS